MQRRDRQGEIHLSVERLRYHPGDGKGGFKLDVKNGMVIPARLEDQRSYAVNLLAWATKAVNYSNIAMQYIAAYHGHYGRPLNYSHHILIHNIKVNRANEAFRHQVVEKFKNHVFFVENEDLHKRANKPDSASVTSTYVVPHDFDIDVPVVRLDLGRDIKPLRMMCFTEEDASRLIDHMVNKSRDISFDPAFVSTNSAENEQMHALMQMKDALIRAIVSVPEIKDFLRDVSPGNINILSESNRGGDVNKLNNAFIRALQIYLISPLGSDYHGAVKYPELHQMIVDYVAKNSELLSMRAANPSLAAVEIRHSDPEVKRKQTGKLSKAEKFKEQLTAVILYKQDTGMLPMQFNNADEIRTYLSTDKSSESAAWLKIIVNELLTQYPEKYGELKSEDFARYPMLQQAFDGMKNELKESEAEPDKSPRHKI